MSRRWRTALLAFVISAVFAATIVVIHKEKYAAVTHVLLVNDQAGRDPADVGLDMPTIVTSTTVLSDVKRKLELRETIPQLRKEVVARVAPRSSIMTIASQNQNPQIAVDLPNAVADSFVLLYSKLSNSRYDEITHRLQADLDHKKRLVVRLERQLERASSGASYVGSQASLDSTAAHLAELKESRGEAFAQLVSDQAALRLNRGETTELSGNVRHEVLMNNASYRQSELEIGRDVAAYTTTRAGVNGSYPGIAGFQDKVRNEVSALKKLGQATLALPDTYSPSEAGLVVSIDKALAASLGDAAKVKNLDEQIATSESALLVVPEAGISIGAIRAERDAAESQYQALALRVTAAEANGAESSSLGQVIVVDRAVKAERTLLGRPLLMLLGLVVAAALATLSAYLAEMLVPRLIGSSDVERIYGQPTLVTLR